MRKRTWQILEIAVPGDGPSRLFDLGIRALIAVNVLVVVLETVPELEGSASGFFRAFDLLSVTVFTVEYLLRLWSAVENPSFSRPFAGRIRYALTPLLLVDLFAILPFFLPFAGLDLRILRGVRLFRLFRILKLARYSEALRTLGRVFARRRAELGLTFALVGLLLLLASSLMYYAEHGAQPEKFSSIPAAMWWGVVTLTTLGYGDVYPVTSAGRVLGGLFALTGVLLIALPTAILGSAFMEEIDSKKGKPRACPHCGRLIEGGE